MNMNIGIFGGSFDPVHLGHKKLADFMTEKLQLDKMLIIPAALSPFKERCADGMDRYNMCRLQFSSEPFEVSDIELRRGGKSYTVETLRSIREQYPEARLYLIIGSDQLLSFNRWYRFSEILSLCTLAAVSRQGGDKKSRLETFCRENLNGFGKTLIFDFTPLEISSTQLRRAIAAGENAAEFLDGRVLRYIQDRGLYSEIL